VGTKKANEEACKMEHALSPATLDRFTDFMDFIHTCPRAGENWLDHFQDYRRHGRQPDKCLEQTEAFSCEFKEKVDSLKQCGSCNVGE
jgi:DtxR family Mn-dependent transcriptional regulator